ncbi:MAG: sn-glycerol-3-phosphate ABC transporter ATP-binding protein UgpC [candidate division KSB1 bacterium]|nr:sn-glycerol-3-phosphate ABC transporter ATP-binding protein UgpC [candidate division KSB1 bacterium]
MARVELKEVTKVFEKNVVAVDKATFTAEDKEFVVLVGPSGCGKSTTLRMIAGLEEVTEGEIYIGDRLVNDVPPKDRDIAMVFQNYALYPHMTVYQNMAFGLKLRKYPKKEIEQRVNEAAEILGIKDLLDRKPKALSGGQRQRVAVGRAIVRKPKVFLFDEPLSNLDAKLRVQMRTEISKLHARLETTMIYVTHDQVEAMTMGDKIVVMKDGVIQQIADPLTLYNRPRNKFVAGFIGSPAMNFFGGRIIHQDGLWFDAAPLRLRIPASLMSLLKPYVEREIIFGIRPEDIHLGEFAGHVREAATATCVVEVVEPMGNEIFLYLSCGPNSMVARIPARREPAVGERMDVVFDMSKVHFFDKSTEEAVAQSQ